MYEAFISQNFKPETQAIIDTGNDIIQEYDDQGYNLTLRQLYYQLVARGFIENSQKSYKRLGDVINNARLAGLMDWDAIEDRTRNLETPASWSSPASIVDTCARQFRLDPWEAQDFRVEVWVEKEALAGVVEVACEEQRLPFLSCRGYMSQSEQYAAAKRIEDRYNKGQRTVILHLGDHDPSGIDMTRDNRARLTMLSNDTPLEVRRIALNMDQIEELKPPPNPAKVTDSRADSYIEQYGYSSWELDALEPSYIKALIHRHAAQYIDLDRWQDALEQEMHYRDQLRDIADGLRE